MPPKASGNDTISPDLMEGIKQCMSAPIKTIFCQEKKTCTACEIKKPEQKETPNMQLRFVENLFQ